MRKIIYIINFIFVCTIIFLSPSNSYSFQGITHQNINEYIIQNIIGDFSFSQYLIEQLGFQNGKDEMLSDKKAFKWLGYGGEMEDQPFTRSFNHFHNPLTNEGYKGIWNSSILWSQLPLRNQTPGGYYSWYDVRGYYYNALTAKDKTTSETSFAETFRGLGQLMHLVQDLSVPEHTRDDTHILPAYEAWVAGNEGGIPNVDIESMTPIFFDPSAIGDESKFTDASVPIANLFDTNQYVDTNPDPSVTLRSDIGLSEYTNANFLSADTMFYDFPYPSFENVHLYREENSLRLYLRSNGNGENVEHLARVGVLSWFRSMFFPWDPTQFPATLDDICYEEYASFLIPRAVGYSAALLEYFFRGELDVTCLPVFYNNNLLALSLKIKNITSSEESMSGGTFDLICKYNDGNNDQFVSKFDVSSGTLEYDNEVEIIFYLPRTSEEEIITKEEYESGVTCTLVFKGTLGNESGAVVGKVFVLGEEIRFNEDWDNGLTGNYPWTHSTAEQNPPNGETVNVVENGILTKENIRYAGFATPRNNETFLYLPDPGIPINQYTSLQFKIDELSINNRPPDGYHWQVMMLYFNNGDLNLQFSIDGQGADLGWPNVGYYSFTPQAVMVGNIYKMFDDMGIQVPDPLNLNMIGFGQQLYELPDPSTMQHAQRMDVDFIRIIDAKPSP